MKTIPRLKLKSDPNYVKPRAFKHSTRLMERKHKKFSSDPVVQKFFEDHAPFEYVGPEAVFHDGATALRSSIRDDTSSGWEHLQGPKDKTRLECAKARVRYFKKLADEAVNFFNTFKEALETPDVFPDDEEETLAELSILRDKARRARAKLRKVEAEVDKETPAWQVERKKIKAEAIRKSAKFRKEVKAIKL